MSYLELMSPLDVMPNSMHNIRLVKSNVSILPVCCLKICKVEENRQSEYLGLIRSASCCLNGQAYSPEQFSANCTYYMTQGTQKHPFIR